MCFLTCLVKFNIYQMLQIYLVALGCSRKDLYPMEEISAIQGGGEEMFKMSKGEGRHVDMIAQGVTLCKKLQQSPQTVVRCEIY